MNTTHCSRKLCKINTGSWLLVLLRKARCPTSRYLPCLFPAKTWTSICVTYRLTTHFIIMYSEKLYSLPLRFNLYSFVEQIPTKFTCSWRFCREEKRINLFSPTYIYLVYHIYVLSKEKIYTAQKTYRLCIERWKYLFLGSDKTGLSAYYVAVVDVVWNLKIL